MSEENKMEQKLEAADTDAADELAALQAKCDEYLNGWKRALADYQNLQKEVAAERDALGKFALASAAMTFVPIYDNFKAAFESLPDLSTVDAAKLKQWLNGVEQIKKQLAETLKSLGVEEIGTVGEKFDPALHESVGEETVTDKASGEIVHEVSSGYKINGKIWRAAKVILAK